jgi:hypothetical protein
MRRKTKIARPTRAAKRSEMVRRLKPTATEEAPLPLRVPRALRILSLDT